MAQCIRRNRIIIVAVIVIFGLITNFLWYPYQKHAASSYLLNFRSSSTCTSGSGLKNLEAAAQNLPCSGDATITVHRFLLGIGAHYFYTTHEMCGGGDAQYSGDVISLLGTHLVFLKQTSPVGPQYDIASC
jgi:hypothetical protein